MHQSKLFIPLTLEVSRSVSLLGQVVWKYFTIACLLLCTTHTYAQMHDNNWVFGISDYINPYHVPDGVIMRFDQGYPTFSVENIRQSYAYYGAVCSDSVGNLLFHTNGRAIRNRLHQIMENGDSINPGYYWDMYRFGYPSLSGAFALPAPGSNHIYYLIHTALAPPPPPGTPPLGDTIYPVLYKTTIDMNANNGLGKVLSKNDTLATGDLPTPVAIKHGNGRDWWLIVGDYQAKKYQTFLLDPSGFHFMFDQDITPEAFSGFTGEQLASPDGRFLLKKNDIHNLWMYDFDRCSGLLSSPRVLPFPKPYFYSLHYAFSKDSRFLYINTDSVVYQLDMQTLDEPEIALDTIARYDHGFYTAASSNALFFAAQLAPDGKIYYNISYNNKAFHVLNRPEFPLLASDFSQQGLIAPQKNNATTYHFPTYTLGRALDAPCDTLPYSGPVEERFRHIPWEGARPDVRDPTEVRVLKLPKRFHFPEHTDHTPYDNPLSPVKMRERAIFHQQQKLKNDAPK